MIEQKFEERIERLDQELEFLGSPQNVFDPIGRNQLMTLIALELQPYHSVLDFGCGALRGGYWLIHFLDPSNYYGIEGRKEMVKTSEDILFRDKTLEYKRPEFDYNTDFDFSVFDEKFDYIIARSVWTHAPKWEIKESLDAFIESTEENSLFLTSAFLNPGDLDYKGIEYKGTNSESIGDDKAFHSLNWIEKECEKKNLDVGIIADDYLNVGNQRWLVIGYD